ncbi:MAG: hypothetical protein J6F30_17335 [Cellulosilyticum sp.]|nr:hypothetical protein [Cellulosilyticum sp.]
MDVNTSLYSPSNVSPDSKNTKATSNSTITSTNTATSSTTNSTSPNQSTSKTNSSNTFSTATDSYISSSQNAVKGLYSKPQKLTDEQIKALKEAQAESQKQLVQKLTESLFVGQSSTSKSASNKKDSDKLSTLLKEITDANHLPEIATDPEEAEKALTGNGPYSVNSVATRIMDMATSLAGNNPEKLELMRSAVKKGFESAGMTFSKITGDDKLPQICQDTYDEVMKRFDELQ